jgi:hypothetical protein
MCKTFARLTRTEPSQPVNRRFQRLAATTLVAITGHADDAGRQHSKSASMCMCPSPAMQASLSGFGSGLERMTWVCRHPHDLPRKNKCTSALETARLSCLRRRGRIDGGMRSLPASLQTEAGSRAGSVDIPPRWTVDHPRPRTMRNALAGRHRESG